MSKLQNNLSCYWNVHRTVNVCIVVSFFLKYSSKLQDEFWHAPSGETLNNHVFHVNLDDPKSMFIQVYCDTPKKKLTIEKAKVDTNQLTGMQPMVLPSL